MRKQNREQMPRLEKWIRTVLGEWATVPSDATVRRLPFATLGLLSIGHSSKLSWNTFMHSCLWETPTPKRQVNPFRTQLSSCVVFSRSRPQQYSAIGTRFRIPIFIFGY
jgi:hypothetical protein